jgi:hypothetical protein
MCICIDVNEKNLCISYVLLDMSTYTSFVASLLCVGC